LTILTSTHPVTNVGSLVAGADVVMLTLLSTAPTRLNHGHKRASVRPQPLILSVQPSVNEDKVLPANFDWRDVDGRSLVTADVNQHIPTYCGSCWIHGTIAALNDRIKIARHGRFPDVMLSRQVAMNCVHGLDDTEKKAAPPGCNGGDPWAIHSHMVQSPLPDESCQPYEAKNGVCVAAGQCRNCYHPSMVASSSTPRVDYTSPGCFAVEAGVRYGVREYGGVAGVLPMQREILARGPIVCSFAADSTFMLKFEERLLDGVYVDPSYFAPRLGGHNNSEVDHDVEITGWGVTPGGLPYWVARNSWGTYWGERGWFKILRGANHLFIEEDCAWAVPDTSALEDNLAAPKVGDYVNGAQTTVVDELSAQAVKAAAQAAIVAAAASSARASAAAAKSLGKKEREAKAA